MLERNLRLEEDTSLTFESMTLVYLELMLS